MRKTLAAMTCLLSCAFLFSCSSPQRNQPTGTPNSNVPLTASSNQPPEKSSGQTNNNSGTGTGGASSGSQSSGSGNGAPGTNATGWASSVNPPSLPRLPMLKVGSTGRDVYELNELLAETGYLPLVYTNSDGNGKFTWKYKDTPASLAALWKSSTYTLLTKSAVMTFESTHGLAADGVAGPKVWAAMQKDAASGVKSPYGMTYVQVSLKTPQKLTLWHDGKAILTAPVNSGIPQSPTVTGTYPVYLQYLSQTMSGTDVFGHHYSDPGVPYVSYFYGGEAIHGFPRAAYGYPQSLGCVELPISAAKRVWPYMHLGTLVHIS